jgi:hypothetical protein
MGYCTSANADSHRLIVLDIGRFPTGRPGSQEHRLLLFDIDSGKVVSAAKLGFNTSIGVSPRGDAVAALSYVRANVPGGSTILSYFRGKDLSPAETGRFPDNIPRLAYQLGAAADIALSPDGKALLLCGLGGGGNVDLAATVLTPVRRELDNGSFKVGKTVRIPHCRSVDFVSLAGWPRIHVLNHTFTLLEAVDLQTGEIRSKLPLGDDPAMGQINLTALEKADFGLILRVRNQGTVVAGGRRYAYYIPLPASHHPAAPAYRKQGGFLKKIDLHADPPRVIARGKSAEADLNNAIAAVSESAGALFVLELRHNPRRAQEPSHWVKVFRTSDLKYQREIELPLKDCASLRVSSDGKYLYALNPEEAKLAVLDAGSGRTVKVLDVPARYPLLVLPVPAGD